MASRVRVWKTLGVPMSSAVSASRALISSASCASSAARRSGGAWARPRARRQSAGSSIKGDGLMFWTRPGNVP